MYNYIDEVPLEVQNKADKYFEKRHTFVVNITTGFKTGFETRVKTVQVESRDELYKLLEKWMKRSTADKCEFNYEISDCGGNDIPKEEYETMENIYSDGTTEDLPF